jgi:PAS domain S-box-containing protein
MFKYLHHPETVAAAIIHSPAFYLVRTDLDGKYTYVNAHFAHKFSFISDNFIGLPFAETVHPDDIEACNQAAYQALTHPDTVVPLVIRKPGPGANSVYTYWEFSVVSHASNPVTEIQCVGHDITGEIRAHQISWEYSQKIDIILESITEGFFAVDHQWNIIQVNRSFEQMLNLSRQELLGRKLWSILPQARNQAFSEHFHRSMLEKSSFHQEEYFPALDAWYNTSVYPSDSGLVVYWRDITGRKRGEEELRKSFLKLNAIQNSTTDVHLLISPDYRIISFNRKAAEKYRLVYDQELPEEISLLEIIPSHLKERFVISFTQALAGNSIILEDKLAYNTEAGVWYRVEYFPVKDTSGEIIGVALNISDIDQRKRTELQIQEQNRTLREIAHIQSHQIRRPVATILGLINLLNPEDFSNADASMIIEMLKKSAEELDTVIHQIVEKTGEIDLEPGKYTPKNL